MSPLRLSRPIDTRTGAASCVRSAEERVDFGALPDFGDDGLSAPVAPASEPAPYARPISAYEFIRTMLLAGFRLKGSVGGHAIIESRAHIAVFVPIGDALTSEQVALLLATAEVSPDEFAALRERLVRDRETWPDLGLETLEPACKGAESVGFSDAEATTEVEGAALCDAPDLGAPATTRAR